MLATPGSTPPPLGAHERAFAYVQSPSLQKLAQSQTSTQAQRELLAIVTKDIVRASTKRKREEYYKPGDLSMKPEHKHATRPGFKRTGRPVTGKRVGRGGLWTPDKKKNTRNEEDIILRRDLGAQARLRLAAQVQAAVQAGSCLKRVRHTKQELQYVSND